MISKVALLVLTIGLASASVLPTISLSEGKGSGLGIYNGKTTDITKHNYLVAIVYKGNFACAGTIVSNNWVVTLAECVQGISTNYELNVIAGSSNGVTGTSYNTSKVVVHPSYGNATNMDYNYACLQIDGTFSFSDKVGKVVLPAKEAAAGLTVDVAGYGDTDSSTGTGKSRTLMHGQMKWVAKNTCQTTYASYLTWTDRMACASSAQKVTLCNGDWGNAFVKGKKFFGMFASGISTGFCTKSAKPVLIADIFPVVSWIQQTTMATVE